MSSFYMPSTNTDSSINFQPLISPDIKILFPTVYTKLNLLNYCQFLRVFLRLKNQHSSCEHTEIIETKIKTVKQVISRIVETDTVFSEMQ
nr:homolog of EHV2 ORF67A DNA packaging protein UL33 [Macronycteris gammaherpesvirus 1]